jgi:hypothetical protein
VLGAAVALLPVACRSRADDSPVAPAASTHPAVTAANAAASAAATAKGDAGGQRIDAPTLSEKRSPAVSCRALVVKGSVVETGGHALESGMLLDRPAFLDLATGSELTVKHAVTGRELTFHGPAHILPCERGEERFLIASGRVVTNTWAGARPGVEVLIATPFALVRYGDAELDISVSEQSLSVKAARGDAWLSGGKEGVPDRKVAAGTHDEVRGPAKDAKVAVEACTVAAGVAEAGARDVLSSHQTTPLGERASVHVRARRAATAACAVASAVLARSSGTEGASGTENAELLRALRRAEEQYRALPSLAPVHP